MVHLHTTVADIKPYGGRMDERLVKSLERIARYLRWVIGGEIVIALLLAALVAK